MVKDALLLSNSHFNFLECIKDPKRYIQLDDFLINKIENFKNSKKNLSNDLKKASEIITRIRNRDIYKWAGEMIVPKPKYYDIDKIYNDMLCYNNPNNEITRNDIDVYEMSIDYGNGDKNPFDNIDFYNPNNLYNNFLIPSNKISLTVPDKFKESYIRIYCKDKNKLEKVKEMFTYFIEKNTNKEINKQLNKEINSQEIITSDFNNYDNINNKIDNNMNNIRENIINLNGNNNLNNILLNKKRDHQTPLKDATNSNCKLNKKN
jgi:hypothetical protein